MLGLEIIVDYDMKEKKMGIELIVDLNEKKMMGVKLIVYLDR